jgi:hypothetical protein
MYPFRDDGLKLADVEEILRTSGVGMPPYTEWGRTRSGCYFCFYQQKIEWVRLKEKHPELFEEAKKYERPYAGSGNVFTWSSGESLTELEEPTRQETIRREHARRLEAREIRGENLTLAQVFERQRNAIAPDEEEACLICTL